MLGSGCAMQLPSMLVRFRSPPPPTPLPDCTVAREPYEAWRKNHAFSIRTDARYWKLHAESDAELRRWLAILERALLDQAIEAVRMDALLLPAGPGGGGATGTGAGDTNALEAALARERAHVIGEILASEASYVHDLDQVRDFASGGGGKGVGEWVRRGVRERG